jgi:hypothetical protein
MKSLYKIDEEEEKMRLMSREGDLTIHICSDCGGQIHGDCRTQEENGIKKYYHPDRCANGMTALTERRDAHFIKKTGSTQRTGAIKQV